MNQPPPMPPQPPMPTYGGPTISTKQFTPKHIKYIYWGGIATALLGVVILAISTWVYAFSGESASWQSTEGQIVNSRILTKISRTSRTGSAVGGRRYNSQGIRYYAEPQYRYRVNGTFHQSTRFALARTAPDFRTREEAVAFQEQNFPHGGKLPVYYNPEDPMWAVLEPTRDKDGWMFFAMGFAFLLMAGLVFFIGNHENRRFAAPQNGQFTGAA
jgi:hypothetical protein